MNILKKMKNKGMLFATPWDIFVTRGVSGDFSTLDGTVGKVADLINIAINFGGLVAAILLVAGGYMMITAGGDSEKIENGSNTVTNAVIGLVVVFLAKLIIVFVADFLG